MDKLSREQFINLMLEKRELERKRMEQMECIEYIEYAICRSVVVLKFNALSLQIEMGGEIYPYDRTRKTARSN